MKKILLGSLLFAFAVFVASPAFADEGSWTGFVTDSGCGASGAKADHADCAVKCVKEKGAKWALYNPADKSLFVLSGDDATMGKMAGMAGKKVMVKGTVDAEKKVITVASMEPGA
ncbi:MAG: hypothetical protein ABI592_09340 [Acidobacteriota bacterium]